MNTSNNGSSTNNEQLLEIMMEASRSATTHSLTLDAVKQLKGIKIRTIYFGYKGQNGVDEFIVGDVVTEEEYIRSFNPTWVNKYDATDWYNPANTLHLLTADGRATCIRLHKENVIYNNSFFTCSDSDRFVDYILAD